MPQVGPLKIKVQMICGDDLAMGPGKADLLEAIDREGSISAAGRSLGMSYRRAWLLTDTMNRCWREPLVEATAGGGKARGARLTPLGRDVVAAYRLLEAGLVRAASGNALEMLKARMRDQPRPPRLASPSDTT